jgi:hypothetical protein
MKKLILCFAFLLSLMPLVAQNTFAISVDTPDISSQKTFVSVVETPNAYVVANEDRSGIFDIQTYLFEISKQGGILRKVALAPIDSNFQILNLKVFGEYLLCLGNTYSPGLNDKIFAMYILRNRDFSLAGVYKDSSRFIPFGKIPNFIDRDSNLLLTRFIVDSSSTIHTRIYKFDKNLQFIRKATITQLTVSSIAESKNGDGYAVFGDWGQATLNSNLAVTYVNVEAIYHASQRTTTLKIGDRYFTAGMRYYIGRGITNSLYAEERYSLGYDIVRSRDVSPVGSGDQKAAENNCFVALGNHFYVCGYGRDNGTDSSAGIILQKLDRNLETVWIKKFKKGTFTLPYSLQATSDNSLLIAGAYFSATQGIGRVAYLLKLNADGLMVSETKIPMPDMNVRVFPNPASDFMQLEVPVTENVDIQVFDAAGKLVISEKEQSPNKRISVKHLLAGNYVLQVWQKGQLLGVTQWIKI